MFSFLGGALLQIIVVIVPSWAEVFKLTNLTTKQWLCTIVISLMPIILIEMQKVFNTFMFGKVVQPRIRITNIRKKKKIWVIITQIFFLYFLKIF